MAEGEEGVQGLDRIYNDTGTVGLDAVRCELNGAECRVGIWSLKLWRPLSK